MLGILTAAKSKQNRFVAKSKEAGVCVVYTIALFSSLTFSVTEVIVALKPPEFGRLKLPQTDIGGVGQILYNGSSSMLPCKLSLECSKQMSST